MKIIGYSHDHKAIAELTDLEVDLLRELRDSPGTFALLSSLHDLSAVKDRIQRIMDLNREAEEKLPPPAEKEATNAG